MNKIKLTSFICGGILSLHGASLLAQQSSTTDPSSAGSAGHSAATSSSVTDSGSTSGHWQHSGQYSGQSVRLSDLMNSTVQASDGKTLGSIRDFTIDPQSGHVRFAILSLSPAGGATDTSTSGRETVPSSRSSISGTPSSSSGLGMTGKLIPVPWQLFSQSMNSSAANSSATTTTSGTSGSHHLVLNLDESKLQSAPSFDASNWSDMQQSSFDQRVYSYYGVNRMSGAGTSGSSISGQGTGSIDSRGASNRDPSTHDYGTGNATGGTGAKGGATDLKK
jgi:sporulation protein YlmC with PRC-barrel domain